MRDSMESAMSDEHDPDDNLSEAELNALFEEGTPIDVYFGAAPVVYPGSVTNEAAVQAHAMGSTTSSTTELLGSNRSAEKVA
jgi:hypothetical protein